MKLTEELYLMNKRRNQLKRFWKYESSQINKTSLCKQISVIFLDLQQSKFRKGARLKLLKMVIRDMKRCSRMVKETNL